MLVLLNHYILDPRSGPTFEKITLDYRYLTLRTFRSFAGGIFRKVVTPSNFGQNIIVRP